MNEVWIPRSLSALPPSQPRCCPRCSPPPHSPPGALPPCLPPPLPPLIPPPVPSSPPGLHCQLEVDHDHNAHVHRTANLNPVVHDAGRVGRAHRVHGHKVDDQCMPGGLQLGGGMGALTRRGREGRRKGEKGGGTYYGHCFQVGRAGLRAFPPLHHPCPAPVPPMYSLVPQLCTSPGKGRSPAGSPAWCRGTAVHQKGGQHNVAVQLQYTHKGGTALSSTSLHTPHRTMSVLCCL